jgi:murein L,D-transpeptidase YafK
MQGFLALLVILDTLAHAGVPRPLPPVEGAVTQVLVDKSDRTLALMQGERVLRMYPVGLGFAPDGDKARQGDGRTPEGTFRIDRRNDASRFHLSLGLDYPQPDDVERAAKGGYAPGGDIFIHGQPDGVEGRARLAGDWTAGCIAVSNVHVEEIWDLVPLGTEVLVRP